ncbi:hypothetical protein F5J12DRAFT_807732 [Pisolithus orientalis]|uniref:uncharacterized protein n=1 Tax=Pisolithus orientalis TaxID=936130 RepID=UPI002224E502|nr:uncharacterized protein F5J12DRAFT_807732 [Pisolithus orientalis]KAI6028788.1 hypothetical protein F5J12DRAFT_807732 [Pisolithus orientalis]
MPSDSPLPAHQTKHLPTLTYPFIYSTFYLAQSSDGTSNGTALWLGAQLLSAYLAAELKDVHLKTTRPRAVELGSGIGLTALALASLGYDVLATDTAYVCDSVLRNNIRTNLPHLHSTRAGTVQVRALDWLVSSDMWNWGDPLSITPAAQSNEGPEASGVEETLRPPFDLIVSSDTLYDESLIDPLFTTLQALFIQGRDTTSFLPNKPPVILIALERRDPALISTALARAPEELVQVPTRKLKKALDRSGIRWDGVEIWRGVGRL